MVDSPYPSKGGRITASGVARWDLFCYSNGVATDKKTIYRRLRFAVAVAVAGGQPRDWAGFANCIWTLKASVNIDSGVCN